MTGASTLEVGGRSALEAVPTRTLRCAIVGAAGYSGAELLHLLLGHPDAAPIALFGSARHGDSATPIVDTFPRFAGRTALSVTPATASAILDAAPDVVFLATPNEVSHELVPSLLDAAAAPSLVVDLSGAFRLGDAALYQHHYGFAHTRADLLERAVYGLVERNRPALRGATLVANPGCYPTASILALAPFVDAGAIALAPRPIIDAVSGVSGAGRGAELRNHFCEVSMMPYGVLTHRHTPEIDRFVGMRTIFTPHLGPYDRGILATVHAQLVPGVDAAGARAILEGAYASEPFVRVLPAGRWPSVNAVRGTNVCQLGVAVDEFDGHLIVVAAIDNLVKGAAGQAIQVMNARFGLDETLGLVAHGASRRLDKEGGAA